MKPGIYFSDEFGDQITYHKVTEDGFELGCHAVSPLINFKHSDLVELILNQHYEYICELWDESAELERYKCAIDIAKRNFKQLVLARCSIVEALDFVDIFNKEINEILNGDR